MVGHTGVDECVETSGNVLIVNFDQDAIARYFAARGNGVSFKGGHVILVIATPEAGDRDRLIGSKLTIDHVRLDNIKVGSEGGAILRTDGVAHIQGRHARMPEEDGGLVMLQPVGEEPGSQSQGRTHQAADGSVDVAFNGNGMAGGAQT